MYRTIALAAATAVTMFVAGASAQDEATQNAVLEGVQLSSEPGTEQGEKVVSCYFIFRDKPSSFFYEIKDKEKKLVFEFNDVKKGVSPVESMSEAPIKGFEVGEKRVNVNEQVQGLEPEWHSVVTVTFALDAIPIITVNEEYSVISFSYKWGTDPSKMDKYVQKDNKKKYWLIGGLAGAGAVGAAVAVIAVLGGDDGGDGEDPVLDDKDLPVHTPYTP